MSGDSAVRVGTGGARKEGIRADSASPRPSTCRRRGGNRTTVHDTSSRNRRRPDARHDDGGCRVSRGVNYDGLSHGRMRSSPPRSSSEHCGRPAVLKPANATPVRRRRALEQCRQSTLDAGNSPKIGFALRRRGARVAALSDDIAQTVHDSGNGSGFCGKRPKAGSGGGFRLCPRCGGYLQARADTSRSARGR